MKEPLVTICTAVYNHEKYLEDYFKSIISQTYNNIELVIIDDCSTDNSVDIIKDWLPKLEERFKRVVFIVREKNKGLIFNCNEGISVAEGKYIAIFASDDMMREDNIEKKVAFLEANSDYALVYSDGYIVREEINRSNISQGIINKFSEQQLFYEGHIFQKLIDEGCFIPAPTVLARRSILIEMGGYSEEYIFEDYYMWLRIAQHYKIGVIREPLVYYRKSEGSLSRRKDFYKILVRDHEKLLYNLSKEIEGLDINKGLMNLYINACKTFYAYDMKSDFFDYYRKISNKNFAIIIRGILLKLHINYNTVQKIKKKLFK